MRWRRESVPLNVQKGKSITIGVKKIPVKTVKIGGYVPPLEAEGGLDTIFGIGNNQAYNQQHTSMYSFDHCRVYAVSFDDLF
jgi:hypothetical protein